MIDTYRASDIQVLSCAHGVRKRPGMYIGGVDARGIEHLVMEVVGNVLDVHLRREATALHVDVSSDGWITVRDDGPGIPVSLAHDGASVLEVVLTRLHAGATYDGHYPHVHVTQGLSGTGLVVVNALSEELQVETTREGIRWAMSFERGVPTSPLRRLGPTVLGGTWIRFRPDPAIFGTSQLDAGRLGERLQQLAWLHPLLGIWFQERRLAAQGGIPRWAQTLAADRGGARASYATCQTSEGVLVDLALVWTDAPDLAVRSFVNANETTSGTHVTGLWQGLAEVAHALGAPARPATNARAVLGRGLVAIIHVGMFGPQFGSPTREQLVNPIAATAVAKLLAHDLPAAAERDRALRRFLCDRLGIPT